VGCFFFYISFLGLVVILPCVVSAELSFDSN
jgi:hypothetical protein